MSFIDIQHPTKHSLLLGSVQSHYSIYCGFSSFCSLRWPSMSGRRFLTNCPAVWLAAVFHNDNDYITTHAISTLCLVSTHGGTKLLIDFPFTDLCSPCGNLTELKSQRQPFHCHVLPWLSWGTAGRNISMKSKILLKLQILFLIWLSEPSWVERRQVMHWSTLNSKVSQPDLKKKKVDVAIPNLFISKISLLRNHIWAFFFKQRRMLWSPTFSKIPFRASEVNSSFEILRSSPVSILQWM